MADRVVLPAILKPLLCWFIVCLYCVFWKLYLYQCNKSLSLLVASFFNFLFNFLFSLRRFILYVNFNRKIPQVVDFKSSNFDKSYFQYSLSICWIAAPRLKMSWMFTFPFFAQSPGERSENIRKRKSLLNKLKKKIIILLIWINSSDKRWSDYNLGSFCLN